jgi:hypothetical protein
VSWLELRVGLLAAPPGSPRLASGVRYPSPTTPVVSASRFVWRTSRDERVRDEHDDLDGESFAWESPPAEGIPGEAINCRCSAEPDFSEVAEA